MLRRIVEISGEGRRLSLKRGFLTVFGDEGPLGRVPLDDIEAVVAATPATSYSGQVLAALAARGAPVVIGGGGMSLGMLLLLATLAGDGAASHPALVMVGWSRPISRWTSGRTP